MFWAIILTLVISWLSFTVVTMRFRIIEKRTECDRLQRKTQTLESKLAECRDFETNRRVKDSYKRGLYDGRETDRAYRELLKRYADGDYDDRAYEKLQKEGVKR